MIKLFQAFIISIAIALFAFAIDFYRFSHQALTILDDGYVDYIFKPGSNMKTLARDLYKMDLLSTKRDRYYLMFLAKYNGQDQSLKAGEYRIIAQTTVPDLLDQIAGGKVLYHSITLVNGWTFARALQEVEENPYLKHQVAKLTPKTIMAFAKLPQTNPEGLLYPETYYFVRNYSAQAMVRWAYDSLQEVLEKEWRGRAKGLPYKTSYQALIAASLIEKETRLDKEREIISGVIVRRLQRRMRLQFDPTVIYGLGDAYDGNITKADLLQETPYNTYRNRGLPPTPIALPGVRSIHAAMHPDHSGVLYFVATGNGGHVFSKTLEEHNQAVAKYILKRGG